MDIFKNGRVVDLTRRLTPEQEKFRLELKTFNVEEIAPEFTRQPGDWYILQEWYVSSHIGTHVESPFHHIKDGKDVADLSLQQMMGEAVILDFHHKKEREAITVDEVAACAADIRRGDIALVRTGYDRLYNHPNYDRPYMSLEAVSWLITRGIKCLGIDASGIELYKAQEQPCHKALFGANIPIIEELTHLEDVHQQRVYFMALPIPIVGADACPVRAVAIEED